MTDNITVVVGKARPVGDQNIPDVCIAVTGETPEHETLDQQEAFFNYQAVMIESLLRRSLPGGLYDRLAAQMLQRAASHLAVSHVRPVREIQNAPESAEFGPCPFCGSSNTTQQFVGCYIGKCLDCGATGPMANAIGEAATKWNEAQDRQTSMLAALELGDVLGNPGPALLEHAAELLGDFAPHTTKELYRKAEAERQAILKARGQKEVQHA